MTVDKALRYIAWVADLLKESEGELRRGVAIVAKEEIADTLKDCLTVIETHLLLSSEGSSSVH